MSQIDVTSLLSQMRALSAQASPIAPAAQPANAAGLDFGALFKQSLGAVATQQSQSQAKINAFERGDAGADIGKTMIAEQKADLAFRGLVQVRNKLTDAYTTIMNMPI